MDRAYNPMIDNGLFVAEYYLDVPYSDITIDLLVNNIELFSSKIAEVIDSNEFYRKIAYSTHINSSLTQVPRKNSREFIIYKQFKEVLDNIGDDKNCFCCGKKQVNIDFKIDRKFLYGLVSQTFYNSSNNLQTVDLCPLCAFLSMLSLLNIQKIGMPTLYISDSDEAMRYVTKTIQGILKKGEDIETLLDKDSNLKTKELIDLSLSDFNNIGYLTQFCFQNSGQIINDIERTLYKKDIELLLLLDKKGLLDEFMGFGFHNRLVFDKPLITKVIYCSPGLYEVLEGFEMNEEERKIVEYATKVLIEIETIEKILKDLKLCNSKVKFNNLILEYSDIKVLVKNIKDYDVLIGSNWYKFRDYISMNLLINKSEGE